MNGKMVETRFTIQFSRTDPAHLQAAAILNRQGKRSKAQYLANAVLHYENCVEKSTIQRPAGFDEKLIEAVVNRILHEKEANNAETPAAADSVNEANSVQSAKDADYDDAVDSIGEAGLNAIAGALDMFRKK